jgi:hypothetical protein
MVTHTRLNPGPGNFDGSLSDTRWGQTFIATGTSLAAADLFAASTDDNFALTWRIFEGGPDGEQIGPTKEISGAWFASSTDLLGVSYNPNDVILIPGQTYYIDVTDVTNFTPFVQESWNSYSDGTAFRNGVATGHDLAMTIMEYSFPPQSKSADLNHDGKIDTKDYCILAGNWHQDESSVDIAPQPLGDGSVDLKDLGFLVENWLTGTKIPPLPGPAGILFPPCGGAGISKDADLSWTPGSDAASYDVYFGTVSPPAFQVNQTETTFDPGTMIPGATYYWRIDSVNGWGTTEGQVWSFMTMLPPF